MYMCIYILQSGEFNLFCTCKDNLIVKETGFQQLLLCMYSFLLQRHSAGICLNVGSNHDLLILAFLSSMSTVYLNIYIYIVIVVIELTTPLLRRQRASALESLAREN